MSVFLSTPPRTIPAPALKKQPPAELPALSGMMIFRIMAFERPALPSVLF